MRKPNLIAELLVRQTEVTYLLQLRHYSEAFNVLNKMKGLLNSSPDVPEKELRDK